MRHLPYQEMIEQARCVGADPLIFDSEEKEHVEYVAKTYCNDCPVRMDCQAIATEAGFVSNIWGGLSTNQRTRMRPNLVLTGLMWKDPEFLPISEYLVSQIHRSQDNPTPEYWLPTSLEGLEYPA